MCVCVSLQHVLELPGWSVETRMISRAASNIHAECSGGLTVYLGPAILNAMLNELLREKYENEVQVDESQNLYFRIASLWRLLIW